MESSPAVRTTCFRLRHAPMGFHATIASTHLAAAPLAPETKGSMKTDRTPAPNREPSHETPLWPTLAVLG